jgi:hypothetical protein
VALLLLIDLLTFVSALTVGGGWLRGNRKEQNIGGFRRVRVSSIVVTMTQKAKVTGR